MVKRDEARTRGQLLRAELNETFDHALRAAGHAAGGVNAAVRPRLDAARGRVAPAAGKARDAAARRWGSTRAAFVPLSEAAHAKVKDAKTAGRKLRRGQEPRRRWPVVAGVVAAGAVVGGLAAMLVRRGRQQWDSYQPDEAFESAPAGPVGATPAGAATAGATPAGLAPPDGTQQQPSPEAAAARHNSVSRPS